MVSEKSLQTKCEYYLITYAEQNANTTWGIVLDNLLNTIKSNALFLHPLKTT